MKSSAEITQFSAKADMRLDMVRGSMRRDQEPVCCAPGQRMQFSAPSTLAKHASTRLGLARWQKRKVERFLAENLERSLRLTELAGQIPLSVSHFSRLFKESFGTTPHMYIVLLKLESAQRRMLSTDDALSQIALTCGLSDQAHLSKIFRRCVGETPSEWRRQALAKSA